MQRSASVADEKMWVKDKARMLAKKQLQMFMIKNGKTTKLSILESVGFKWEFYVVVCKIWNYLKKLRLIFLYNRLYYLLKIIQKF